MGPRALPTLPVTPSTSREQQSALPRPVLPSPVTSAEQTQPQRPVRPMLPPPPETGPDQVQPSHSRPRMERRQVQKFDKPPVLGESGAGKENVEPAVRGLQHSGSKPALHKQPSQHLGAGADKEKAFADQVNALNEGKGVKVKHMIEKLEGAEKLTGALEKRLELMEPLVGTLLVVKEGLKKVLETTGMDKPEVRNDPEHDINYDPVIFSSASGAANTLDGISCEAAILKVKEKSKGVSDKTKSSQLAVFTNQLTELCKLTKDLSRTPQKKVSEAEAFNKVFAQAKRLF